MLPLLSGRCLPVRCTIYHFWINRADSSPRQENNRIASVRHQSRQSFRPGPKSLITPSRPAIRDCEFPCEVVHRTCGKAALVISAMVARCSTAQARGASPSSAQTKKLLLPCCFSSSSSTPRFVRGRFGKGPTNHVKVLLLSSFH